MPAGRQHGAAEIVVFMALGAVAHAVLNPEIDADADEQHGEIDRDQVQCADHQEAERGRQSEADEQVDEYRKDQPRRAQRQPQDDEHDDDGDETVAHGAFLDGGEFLVRHRHRPGESDGRLESRSDLGRSLADGVGGGMAGLQRAVVEHRAHHDEAAQLAWLGRTAPDQNAPGEARRLAIDDRFQGVGGHVENAREVVELDAFGLDPDQAVLERAYEPAQTRIDREIVNERLRLNEGRKATLEFLRRLEQEAIAGKKLAAAGLGHRADAVLVFGQRLRQCGRRLARQLRCRRLDDDENLLEPAERLLESEFPLAPTQIGREQRAYIGVDGEMARDIDPGCRRQHQAGCNDAPSIACAEVDDANNDRCEHAAWLIQSPERTLRNQPRQCAVRPNAIRPESILPRP